MLRPSQNEKNALSDSSGCLQKGNAEFIPSAKWGEDVDIDVSQVEKNLQEIKQDIAHSKVKIVAVTKYFGLKSIIAGYQAG